MGKYREDVETVLATSTNAWPDATNTGVPAGVTLTPSGDVVITQAGAVVSGLNITGSVYIRADNVTLENCKVTSGGWAGVTIDPGVTGAVVQNSPSMAPAAPIPTVMR
jgi:hypothetical protein